MRDLLCAYPGEIFAAIQDLLISKCRGFCPKKLMMLSLSIVYQSSKVFVLNPVFCLVTFILWRFLDPLRFDFILQVAFEALRI